MSKRGNLDNVVTYEHICDTTADMQKIDSKYITLGSTCIVISGDTGGMEVYLANSNKTWSPLGMISGGGGSGDGGGGSGSGITVIECEVFEENGHTYLRNAGQLVAALDDMTENPAHGFNYAVGMHVDGYYMHGFACMINYQPTYGFMTVNNFNVAYKDGEDFGNEGGPDYHATDNYRFQATDIDENGTATLTYTGD